MTFLILWILSSFIGILLAPLIMLVVGKQLKVVSDKLKYGSFLWIIFIAGLLGNFFKDLFPFSLVVVTTILILVPVKKQLKITWPQAIAITSSGLIVLLLLNYVSSLIFSPFFI